MIANGTAAPAGPASRPRAASARIVDLSRRLKVAIDYRQELTAEKQADDEWLVTKP
jgi:hypothetical protein